jgi:hypothetical protein
MIDKPKTSSIDKLSLSDRVLVNKLIVLCGDYYQRVANPSKPGPHTNPQEIDDLRRELLLISLRVGERVWYPRGKPGRTDSIHMPKNKKK